MSETAAAPGETPEPDLGRAAAADAEPDSIEAARWGLVKASAVVFIASAATLVLELVAGRLMAPSIGVNLYSWTSIIGVVLLGIALGNYAGGRLADTRASETLLGTIFVAGALAALLVLGIVDPAVHLVLGWNLPAAAQNLLATLFTFFLPSLILGMVTPITIRLTVRDLGGVGGVVGKIYAWSTAGSILGTFLTGFVLVATFGTRAIVFGVAITLFVIGAYVGRVHRYLWRMVGLIAVVIGGSVLLLNTGAFKPPCDYESQYYCISWDNRGPGRVPDPTVRRLILDGMVHSYNSDDPLKLGYGYERVYADVVQQITRLERAPKSLFIGGGGYTFPRWMQVMYPDGRSDVLEIDPEVFRVAYQDLGIDPALNIHTYTVDARLFFDRNVPEGEYDIVFGDAFHNFSVPYHLTTLEFNRLVVRALRPGGIYVMNLIDRFPDANFLAAYVRTAREAFAHVYVLTDNFMSDTSLRTTFVVLSSDEPVNFEALYTPIALELGRSVEFHVLADDRVAELVGRDDFLLTDDYVPVDNLLAPLITSRTTSQAGG
ncbi:MAG: fused MFS/spermidine synthase [Chloroflexota bacterium]|nr:fused MFS/spermidine synthase [Chloroflexota bacterium]MDP6508529.1 fused MFS/spermidine synthase [Chloroflexota bacterium]MDP6756879.1 fused MFS/spermidine synthase [Chloroflexota bacterium]